MSKSFLSTLLIAYFWAKTFSNTKWCDLKLLVIFNIKNNNFINFLDKLSKLSIYTKKCIKKINL